MIIDPAGLLRDGFLLILASQIDDIEMARKAMNNRLFQLTNDKPDKDGERRGLGYTDDHPNVLKVKIVADQLEKVETVAENQLKKYMANSIWADWLKTAPGVGEKTLGRLLAATGDPYWNTLYQRPRTVGELWRYCGYDVENGQARKRRKGQKANWSAEARMRAWNVAKSCEYQSAGTRYRDIYNERRAIDEDAVHNYPCVQCGTKKKDGSPGNPVEGGTPLKLGHKRGRALRAVAKEVLRDLWIEARAHYETQGMSAEQYDYGRVSVAA